MVIFYFLISNVLLIEKMQCPAPSSNSTKHFCWVFHFINMLCHDGIKINVKQSYDVAPLRTVFLMSVTTILYDINSDITGDFK